MSGEKTGIKNKWEDIKRKLSKHTYFIFTLPGLILYTIFFIYPMMSGLYYSMTDWDGIRKSYNFIGLDNFVEVFKDDRIRSSLSFTLKYVVLLLVLTVIISLGIAFLLNANIKMKGFFKSAYFFPAVLSLITVGLIFNQIFYQVLPVIGKALHIKLLSKNILSNPKLAPYGILVVSIWQGVALPTILFLSALQSVPQTLIEAAKIDGANSFQMFKNVMFPFLIPAFNIVCILTLKNGLTVFDYIKAMTDGGPGRATESIGLLVYNYAFRELRFSYGITVSVILFVLIACLSAFQIKTLSRMEVEE
jgi:raffinose/stachyose/melibiose transport system permease protein